MCNAVIVTGWTRTILISNPVLSQMFVAIVLKVIVANFAMNLFIIDLDLISAKKLGAFQVQKFFPRACAKLFLI